MKQKKVALSIFLIAFAFGLNITGVAPILGILNVKYQSQGTSAIQLLQTLPYALLMAGSLLIGYLTSRWSKKKIACVGLLIIGICGVLPIVRESYLLLLVSRVCIGFGFGVVSPINTAIVAEFFQPEERAGYLGLHVVGMGVGSMAGNFLGGMLSSLGYQYFYLVYLVAFLTLAGVALLLPETAPSANRQAGTVKCNPKVYGISTASFVHTLFITAYSTNIAIYILDRVAGSTAVTGFATAVNAAFALLVGASFAKIVKRLKKYTLPVSILAAAAGYAVMVLLPGMAGVFIGSACCGASLSCFMAQCSYMISISVEPEAVAKASGIFSVIGGIGGLLSPILVGMLSRGLWNDTGAGSQFLVSSIGLALLAAVVLIVVCQPIRNKKTMEKKTSWNN